MDSEIPDVFDVVTSPAALSALRAEWDDLWERNGTDYVSGRFSWCWSAWQNVSKPLGRRLHCVVARNEGRLVLVWPFVTYRHAFWKRARPLGPETAEYSSVLVEDDARADARIAEAWQVLSKTSGCDSILLPHVPAGSALERLVVRERRPQVVDLTQISSTRVENDDDRVFVERIFTSKSLLKRRRKLAERGVVTVESVTDSARRGELTRWMLQHKEAWLARTRGKSSWRRTDLYREFLLKALSDSHLVVLAILLDGAPVAACVARVDKQRFETFLSAYDEQYAAFSPGQNLRLESLRFAVERGLEYDLRVGEQTYKSDWTNRHTSAVSYNLANSWWGALAIRVREAQHGIRARLRPRETALSV